MKKILFAVLLILVFCSVALAAIKDSPDGFRDIKWGESPSALGLRVKLAEDQFQSMYEKTGDKLSIGSATLDRIVYVFFQDRELAFVLIHATEGFANSQLLKSAMVARYGEPTLEDENSYYWDDEKVGLLYLYKEEKMFSLVNLSSKKIMGKLEAATKQEAEKAAKDF